MATTKKGRILVQNFVQETFARMNLQQIRSFLLNGTDECRTETTPYRDTLTKCVDPIYNRLENIYPDPAEREKASADLSDALNAYERVFMELDMKAGARLIYHLLLADDQRGGNANA